MATYGALVTTNPALRPLVHYLRDRSLTGCAERVKVDGGSFLQSVEGVKVDQVELLQHV